MIWYLLILGILSCFFGIFILWGYIHIVKKSERVIGNICEIDNGGAGGGVGGTPHNIVVQFTKDGKTIKLTTLNSFFLAPLFKKYKLSQLRKKHVGRQVHIYYNPAKKGQALLREYMWKKFLTGFFLILTGCLLIFAGIMG